MRKIRVGQEDLARYRPGGCISLCPAVTAISQAKEIQIRRARRQSQVVWIALASLMILASALILYMGRNLTFFRDEWTFVIYRDGHDLANFLSSYAGHLMLWPTVFYVFMFHAAGLGHYYIYQIAALPWHLACTLMVFLLARRRVGNFVALAPAVILLFLGSAWMDILWPFQIAFTGAITFGLAAILMLDRDDLLGDGLACVLLLISIGWSGASLPFLAGVVVGLIVRGRLWRRIWVVALPGAAYLLWLAEYGDQQINYAHNLMHAPGYMLQMAAAGVTGITGLPHATDLFLVLLMTAGALRLWQLRRESPLAWESLAMALTFWALTAIARAQDGEPAASRYTYLSVVLLLLFAAGLAPTTPLRRGVMVAILSLATLTIPSNLVALRSGRSDLRLTSYITSAELGAVQLAQGIVAPEYTPDLHGFPGAVPASAFFAATGRYGSSPADSPDEIASSPEYARMSADRVSIQALRIHLQSAPRELRIAKRPPSMSSTGGIVVRHSRKCTIMHGRGLSAGEVLPAHGLLIRSGISTQFGVDLRRFATGFVGPIPSAVSSGSSSFLHPPIDAERKRPWHFRLTLKHGTLMLCSAA